MDMRSDFSLVVGSFALCLVSLSTRVSAQEVAGPSAREQALPVLEPAEVTALSPWFDRGPIALVEFSEGEALPGVVIVRRMAAPADIVAGVIARPDEYPRWMPLLDTVDVTSRNRSTITYNWNWQAAAFALRGECSLTHLRRNDGMHRIAVDFSGGDLGTGRIVWKVSPESATHSLVSMGIRLDLRDANYVARQLAQAARSVNRSLNIGIAFEMLLGIESAATAGQRTTLQPPPAREISPPFEPRSVRPLIDILHRGDLIFAEIASGSLRDVTVVGRLRGERDRIWNAMVDPEAFGQSLIPGSYARTRAHHSDGSVDFDWGVELPLLDTSGRMRITPNERAQTVRMQTLEGSLHEAAWNFRLIPISRRESIVIGSGSFDIGKANWLLRGLVAQSTHFGHGLTSSCQLMTIRALRLQASSRSARPRVSSR